MTKRTFYKTTFRVVVLSEDPIPDDLSLRSVLDEADAGAYVANEASQLTKELNGRQAVNALYKFGSEPGFFRLDDKGNDV